MTLKMFYMQKNTENYYKLNLPYILIVSIKTCLRIRLNMFLSNSNKLQRAEMIITIIKVHN